MKFNRGSPSIGDKLLMMVSAFFKIDLKSEACYFSLSTMVSRTVQVEKGVSEKLAASC